MTTLAANKPRAYEGAPLRITENAIPMIAADIIYEGAAVGIVAASGHARPLVAGDKFRGFACRKVDNAGGGAAALSVDLYEVGHVQLPVTGAVITDVGQPVYAADDDTFQFSPVGATFIGYVHRFVSAGVAIVAFDVSRLADPYGEYTARETLAAAKTLDIEDNGKVFFADTDNTVVTMPAVATPVHCKIVNLGAYGTVKLSVSPQAADRIQGPDLPGTDDTDLTNTKATQRRGDFVRLVGGDANGPIVQELRGIWATAN
jgi:hypothetical protein